ncbi:MAG: NUDIX hydrolase [Anaerolineales bacterium]|nr:NUDIX hydrolase [Anaerolineales bacterium]
MTIHSWKVLNSEYIRKGVRVDTCQLFGGQILEPLVLEYGTWVFLLGITREQQVILIRQYRHGQQQVLWEFPGGMVDPGEDPLEAARREFLEETGYSSDRFIETGKLFPNPGNQNNMMVTYLALDVEKVADQSLDETEEIEVYLKPLNEVLEMVRSGELIQALHVANLFMALMHLGRIG